MSVQAEIKVERASEARRGRRWYWSVWWLDGTSEGCGYGIAGWSFTKAGGRFAAWLQDRKERTA